MGSKPSVLSAIHMRDGWEGHKHTERPSLVIPPSGSVTGSKALSHEPRVQQACPPSRFSFAQIYPIPLSASSPPNPPITHLYRCCQNHPPSANSRLPHSENRNTRSRGLTFVNPISWLFSLKHCRQMLRPYFRIRPALCVQTRLLQWSALIVSYA